MSAPVIVVAGFGRCGSSLTMQMLAAAGFPVLGKAPAYEHDCANLASFNGKFVALCGGKAIKVLDPHKCAFEAGNYKFIWCERSRFQQARSQAKFASLMFDLKLGREAVKSFEESYKRETPKVRAFLDGMSSGTLRIRFEDLIDRSEETAREIADFVGIGIDKVGAMAGVVIPRPLHCQPALEIETRLIDANP